MSFKNVPTTALRRMHDHAITELAEWERSRADAEKRLVSANKMLAEWALDRDEITAELEQRGDFDDEQA